MGGEDVAAGEGRVITAGGGGKGGEGRRCKGRILEGGGSRRDRVKGGGAGQVRLR